MATVPQDFPAPRSNRNPGSSVSSPTGAPGVAVTIPQPRLISFQLEVSTQNRASVFVSQRLRGPVVLLDGSWFSLAIAAPLPPVMFKLYLADSDDGARTDSATLTVPSGVSVWDDLRYSTPGAVPTQLDGITLAGAQSTVVHHRSHRLGFYAGPGDKFLKGMVLASTGAVGQFDVGGWVRVLEGVPEELIPGFL